MTLEQTLWLLAPELVLLGDGALLLLLGALPIRGDKRRWLPVVALGGIAGALFAAVSQWNVEVRFLSVLSCDRFSVAVDVIALVALGLVVLVSGFYARTRRVRYQGPFYALFLLCGLAICLSSAATDLVMALVALELLGIASYVLTGYVRGDPRAGEAAIKHFLYSVALSALTLYGLSWLYGVTGSTGLEAIASAVRASEAELRPAILPALVLIAVGFAAKVAAVPFHRPVPDVHAGTPAPVVAFLLVVPSIAGFAVIMRLFLVALPVDLVVLDADWRTLLMALAAITMTGGTFAAIWQDNVKRLLAYLAVAQAGYLLIGVVAASGQGIAAVLFALLAQTFGTLGALTAIVALARHTGSYAVESYAGMHKQAPEVAWPLLVCLLSMTGVPPLAGFVARLGLYAAAIEQGLLWLAVVGAFNGVVSLYCVWRLVRVLFLAPPVAGAQQAGGAIRRRPAVPLPLAVALGIAVTGVFATALLAGSLLTLLQGAAQVVSSV